MSLNRLRKCPSDISVPGENPIPVPEDVTTQTDEPTCEPADRNKQGAGASGFLQGPRVTDPERIPPDDPLVVEDVSSTQPEPEHRQSMVFPKGDVSLRGKWAGRLRRRQTIEAEVP